MDTLEKIQLTDDCRSDLIKNISLEREKIIAYRVKELLGFDLKLEEEAKRRFKRFAIEREGDSETIYFNDGTSTGKRILTIVSKMTPIERERDGCKISIQYDYY